MATIRLVTFILVLLSLGGRAIAQDELQPGAGYRCNLEAHTFSLASTMRDVASPKMEDPSRFSPILRSQVIRCNLSGAKVTVDIRVVDPHEMGMCSGITNYYIERLTVNGKKVIDGSEPFNDYCTSDLALHSIEVRKAGEKLRVETCNAAWEEGVGFMDVRCEGRDL